MTIATTIELQLWLLQSLGQRRPQGSLLLEMLTPDQQPRVDEVRHAATPPTDLPGSRPGSLAGSGTCTGHRSILPDSTVPIAGGKSGRA